jgi:hypothetical protein
VQIDAIGGIGSASDLTCRFSPSWARLTQIGLLTTMPGIWLALCLPVGRFLQSLQM